LAAIAWLAIRFWAVIAAGRMISSTSAMPASRGQWSANRRSGGLAVRSETTRPTNTGTVASSSATAKPATNSAANRPFACRAKCQ